MILCCRILGAILIVAGLYSVLWGKYKEYQESKLTQEIPEAIKGINVASGTTIMNIEDEDDVEMQKTEANIINNKHLSVVTIPAITVPTTIILPDETTMIAK